MDTQNQNTEVDIAIIGGGVSGIYSAWRLIQADPTRSEKLRRMAAARPDGKLRIAVYEAGDHIGGRLLSLTPPGMPQTRCELGGMRYMSSQKYIRSLVENYFRMATRPLPVAKPENIAHVRGKRVRQGDLSNSERVPYDVAWTERDMSPDDLINYALEQIVPGIKGLSGPALESLVRTFKFGGRHLNHYGFWNLVARALSQEGYELARDTGGYDTTSLNWNAADTILLDCDFAPNVEFKAVIEGYEAVPQRLAEEFRQAGGDIHFGYRLLSLDVNIAGDKPAGVTLQFRVQPGGYDWDTDIGGEPVTVTAQEVILALPRRSLELIQSSGAILDEAQNPGIRRKIRSVTPIPLFKMFLCYPEPWWEKLGITEGRSVTDLPLRQCYYWGVESSLPGANPNNRHAALMASYDDTLNVDFWAGLRDEDNEDFFETQHNALTRTHPGSENWEKYKAPRMMVEEAQRQLLQMHGCPALPTLPYPYAAAFRDWGDDPYGGGVNFWNIHEDSVKIVKEMVNPRPGMPVYVCGEAYSHGQGWAEGALQTAEMVLTQHLGLAAPLWVTEEPVPSHAVVQAMPISQQAGVQTMPAVTTPAR